MINNLIFAIIIIARSGAGKSTLCKQLGILSELHKGFVFKNSVSDTTRPQKNNEIDGVDYNFISMEEFHRRKDSGYYIETDQYAGNWYGSPKNQFIENKTNGILTLYDVEPNGAEKLQHFIGKNNCKIFRLNVPLLELQKRVDSRNRDTAHEKALRIQADQQRIEKMLRLAIPIDYGANVLPEVAANEIYNMIISE
jgi:guanylate kinase